MIEKQVSVAASQDLGGSKRRLSQMRQPSQKGGVLSAQGKSPTALSTAKLSGKAPVSPATGPAGAKKSKRDKELAAAKAA